MRLKLPTAECASPGAGRLVSCSLRYSVLWIVLTFPGNASAFQALKGQGALPEDPRDPEVLKKLGHPYTVSATAHFSIISYVEPKLISQFGELAEETYGRVLSFARRLDLKSRPPSIRMTVVYFDSWTDYAAYARKQEFLVEERVPGFFDERSRRSYIFNYANSEAIRQKRRDIDTARASLSRTNGVPSATEQKARRTKLERIQKIESSLESYMELTTATVVRHEIAHQVLISMGIQKAGDQRRWLCEGLATQFETLRQPNRYRLADFFSAGAGNDPISLVALISDPKLIGPGAVHQQQAYAEAWALTFYLVEEHPREFSLYLKEGRTVHSQEESFERAFVKPDSEFEQRWRSYFDKYR